MALSKEQFLRYAGILCTIDIPTTLITIVTDKKSGEYNLSDRIRGVAAISLGTVATFFLLAGFILSLRQKKEYILLNSGNAQDINDGQDALKPCCGTASWYNFLYISFIFLSSVLLIAGGVLEISRQESEITRCDGLSVGSMLILIANIIQTFNRLCLTPRYEEYGFFRATQKECYEFPIPALCYKPCERH